MKPIWKKITVRTLHVIALVVNVVLALMLVFSAYGGMINPAWTSIGAIAAMLFPVFLLLTVVMAVVNLIWFRRQAIVNGLSLIVCIGPILTFCPMNFFRTSEKSIAGSGKKTLKVMTFNTLNFDSYEMSSGGAAISESGNPTFEYILDQDADIVLCQEAEDIVSAEVHGVTTRQHSMMMERYPYHNVTSRGMAILSKYPFEKIDVQVTDRNQLDVCRYDVQVDSLTFHVFNVHMQSIGLTMQDKELYRNITEGESSAGMREIRSSLVSKLSAAFRSRAIQAQDVRRAIDTLDGTIILCGDFNDIPGSYAARTIEGDDMTDAYRHAGFGPCITYHADRFYFRIDHIFYRGGIEALRVWKGDCTSSDHYPMIAVFEILDNNK